ncbi:hypothetical protein MUK42_19154 [Musa troglodytarum]|uniref:Uncharacterized protein n=1 Tax=Musa troglodytarum TaxID=320322 RepID=A0A9E7FUK4_9LILI|nr:hypothetical protein MUK42_19154 [Musa troglodytarum]
MSWPVGKKFHKRGLSAGSGSWKELPHPCIGIGRLGVDSTTLVLFDDEIDMPRHGPCKRNIYRLTLLLVVIDPVSSWQLSPPQSEASEMMMVDRVPFPREITPLSLTGTSLDRRRRLLLTSMARRQQNNVWLESCAGVGVTVRCR